MPDLPLERLLELYPLEQLRHHFDLPADTKAALIAAIMAGRTDGEIMAFAVTHHTTTKHHVHLRRCANATLRDLPGNPLEDDSMVSRSERTSRQWFYVLSLPFDVYLRDPLERKELEFPWPLSIESTRGGLELRFTIMEKSLAARYEPGRVVKAIKLRDEAKVERDVVEGLALSGVEPEDLNMGIKALWEEGLIDAPAVQFKKARATTRQVMDGDYLLKRDDRALYNELRDRPLLATLFKWMGDDIGLDHFTVDPTAGTITFRTFSKLDEGAAHVVREIRQRNG